MKQTAVEWMVNQLYTKIEMRGDGNLFDEILKQAKEMEKQQQDEFAIQVLEFYHNGLFFIPLKDGEAKQILNYIKKEKGL
jgi:hypothetical protein